MSRATMSKANSKSSQINPMMTGGIVAKRAPKIGMKSNKKHRIPNKNHPGIPKP